MRRTKGSLPRKGWKYLVYGKIKNAIERHCPNCGAVITFEGVVRRDKAGDSYVEKIIYESYEEMAEREIEKIRKESIEKFKLHDVIIKHRIGEVKVGETSLFIAVLAEHRKEGFKAIDYITDEVKTKVPIWKKEILENKQSRWREND